MTTNLWQIYEDPNSNFKQNFETLPIDTRKKINAFIDNIVTYQDPEDHPNVYLCLEEDTLGIDIDNSKVLFKTERIDQGTQQLRILNFIDIVIDNHD